MTVVSWIRNVAGTGREVRTLGAAATTLCAAALCFAQDNHASNAAHTPMDDPQPFHLAAEIAPGSALDVSFLLHRPAGALGPVRAEGERLVFDTGEPARFWGVNMAWDALFPSTEDAGAIARHLARSGANLVRLTYLDGGRNGVFRQDLDHSSTLDPQRMARLDRLVAEMREQGVYTMIVLAMGRKALKPGDDVPAWAIDPDPDKAEAALVIGRYFDDRISDADQKVWRALLTHVNPHTGMRWIDDPALALLEIVNEQSLYYKYGDFDHLPDPLRDLIHERWNRWLIERYGSREALARTWGEQLDADEDPARGSVSWSLDSLKRSTKRGDNSDAKGADWNRFLAEAGQAYYEKQIAFLRDLGAKQPISGNGGGSFGLADKWSNRVGDIFSQHSYFAHPSWGDEPGITYSNASFLDRMWLIRSFSRGRPAGMPYGISEFDFCFPNDWRANGWVPMAAYAQLQGWSYLTAFAYASNAWNDRGAMYGTGPRSGIASVWRFHNDPASFGQYPLTSLMFLRGDVTPAQHTVDITFTEDDVFMAEKAKFPPDPLGTHLEYASLMHRVRQIYAGHAESDETHARVAAGRASGTFRGPTMTPEKGWVRSDTDELRYQPEQGLFIIDTPRTQGVAGSPHRMQPAKTRHLGIECHSDFGNIVASSLDGEPLDRAQRILLIAVGRVQNTGFSPRPGKDGKLHATQEDFGRGPILIEPVRFSLTLQRSQKAAGLKAYALDGAGNRVAEIPIQRKGNALELHIDGSPATIYYELAP